MYVILDTVCYAIIIAMNGVSEASMSEIRSFNTILTLDVRSQLHRRMRGAEIVRPSYFILIKASFRIVA